MQAAQRCAESPGPPGNDHKLTNAAAPSKARHTRTASHGQESVSREATRYLCAATQIDTKYAESVVERVLGEPLKSLAPTFGADVPVVTMWAIKALRTQARRDKLLSTALATLIFLIALLDFFQPWMPILVILLFIFAWLINSWEYWERIHNRVIKKMLRDRFQPGEAPPPTREAERKRLEEIAKRKDGNLVVFSGYSAFAGAGEAVSQQRLLLDISSGSTAGKGAVKWPGHFTAQGIHKAIAEEFDRGLGKSLGNIRVTERLFVNGLHIHDDKRLLPSRLSPPPTSVDSRVLTAAALHPSPDARTYVCIEMPGWQGQLVVTLFARAVRTENSLLVEWTFRALPPLRADFLRIDEYYELPWHRQLRDSLAAGLGGLLPALLQSPAGALRPWYRRQIDRHRLRRLHYAIKHGYIFDYGARHSIREDASEKRWGHYSLGREETMYMLLAEQTLIQAVRHFLSDHGVEMAQFDKQARVFFDNSIHIGDIKDSAGVAIGRNSSTRDSNRQAGEKQAGEQQAGEK